MKSVHSVHKAEEPDRSSVRHRKCWATLLSGLFRATRLRVCVRKGSTLVFRTILGAARAEKAAAEEGSSCGGMLVGVVKLLVVWC